MQVNWTCDRCGTRNMAQRPNCVQCKNIRPQEGGFGGGQRGGKGDRRGGKGDLGRDFGGPRGGRGPEMESRLTCPVCGEILTRATFVSHYEQELRRLLLEQFGSVYEGHVLRIANQLEAQSTYS